ncbi:MAG: OmpA family protein [Paludibacteraceae bacterium]|nr:OmpA family protein [Paludibacteraceae bacterium]
MKKNCIFPFILIGLIGFNACAPVYKCGEAIPAKKSFFWGKRLKTVITERDSLCAKLSATEQQADSLMKDTVALKNKVRQQNNTINGLIIDKNGLIANKDSLIAENNSLKANNGSLKKNYDNLQNEKSSQADQFNKALKLKSNELNQKAKLIAEREKSLKEMQNIISRQDSVSKRLKETLRKALLGFKADELSIENKNGKVYVSMSDKLLFKSGSAAVESKGKDALKVLAEVLVKNPDIDVLVEGHTDNVPIKTAVFKDNWDLSVIRATSIVRILTGEYSVQPTQVSAAGRGEFFPKASNSTPEGRAQNRRTEIILSPKLDEVMKMLNNN